MLKKVILTLVALLVILQFIRSEKNLSDERTNDITTRYKMPENINTILAAACNDCHTNKTRYPWYSSVQPLSWWMSQHVKHGKQHLNFSEFTKRKIAVQNHKLEEIVEMVQEKEMPIPSYTWLGAHGDANLTDEQRLAIIDWSKAQMDSLKRVYPADSLLLRRN
jgi:hypothetical protein